MLKPSLRERKRYIVFKVLSRLAVSEKRVEDYIKKQCLCFLGEKIVSEAGLLFIPDLFKKNVGVLRVSHKHVDEVKTCLALIKENEMIFQTIRVCGTLKKARKIINEVI